MPTSLQNPLLPTHYSVWFDPPDEEGDEVLHFVSERRSLKLKGRSFREFHQRVIPLLNGEHSLEEIESATADIFPADSPPPARSGTPVARPKASHAEPLWAAGGDRWITDPAEDRGLTAVDRQGHLRRPAKPGPAHAGR